MKTENYEESSDVLHKVELGDSSTIASEQMQAICGGQGITEFAAIESNLIGWGVANGVIAGIILGVNPDAIIPLPNV